MEKTTPELDPVTALALEKLNDITLPQPISLMPQTVGWLVLALILLALLAWAALRRHRHYVANRYRRAALAELSHIETTLGSPEVRGQAIAGIAELLKRVALKAWPRAATASLSGQAWLAFLKQHDGGAFCEAPAARLLDDLEYRPRDALAAVEERDARRFADAARRWIERHHVSA